MTTLVVTSSWPRSRDPAAGVFVRDDALARAARGERVVVLAPMGPGAPFAGESAANLVVRDVAHHGLFGSPGAAERLIASPSRAFGMAPFAHAVRLAIAELRPSRVVAHWLAPSGMVVDFAVADATEVELIAHGGDVRLLEAMPAVLARWLLRRLLRRDPDFRVVSASLAARLVDVAPELAGRLRVEPMPLALERAGMNAEVVERGRALRASVGDRRLHVIVSRLIRQKPVDRAIAQAARDREATIVVVGDGPDRGRLEHLAQATSTRFVGAVPHMQALAWIAASDALFAPIGRGEGAPTVVREGRALGRETSIIHG